ncbi:uncharacterized protein ACRADG_010048 [Cochliomyia hominivorax]
MVENRKLFYAISLMLLTCCQIITMFPHNVASGESSSSIRISSTITKTNVSNNSENNNTEMLQPDNGNNNNNNKDSDFLIVAAERIQKQQQTIVSEERLDEVLENDSSRPADNIDDLIFLDKRPINPYNQQQQHHHHHHHQHHLNPDQQLAKSNEQKQHFEFHSHHHHHLTMDGGNSNSNSNSNEENTDSLTETTYSSMIVVHDVEDDDDDVTDTDADGIPHEIELQPDINEEVTPLNVTPLDLSDFLSLIPATKVKTIVNHYYHNDPEVQRAHAFMSSRDFLMLKQHIVAVPEMSAFLRYLNNSGLDLVKFVTALTNLTSYEAADSTIKTTETTTDFSEITTIIAETNDIEYAQKQSDKETPTISNIKIPIATNSAATTTTEATSPASTIESIETTTAKEQLNGLHGLVDSVLDVLPQDQILATFFDKLESNEQFSKLVDSIGSPEFAKILNNMQNSMPLRNLIFTLHNNGIYVIRIVDSLKSYFFLGGF